MQRVQIVAGDDVVGSTLQDIFKALSKPGILEGFEITTNKDLIPNVVDISPGVGLMDSGVFVFEDQTVTTPEVTLGASAKNFTVLYRFASSNVLGGEPAVLSIEEGLLAPDTFTGGLILGWIKHSGGSQFQQSDFILGRRFNLDHPKEKEKGNFIKSFSPLSSKWALVSGYSLTSSEGWVSDYKAIVTTLSNSSISTQSSTYYFPIAIPSTGLGQILVEVEVPATANLEVSFIDTDGIEYSGSEWTFIDGNGNAVVVGNAWTFIATPMNEKILSIPQNLALKNNKMAFIKLKSNLQSGSYIKYKTIGFSSYTEPF